VAEPDGQEDWTESTSLSFCGQSLTNMAQGKRLQKEMNDNSIFKRLVPNSAYAPVITAPFVKDAKGR